MLPEGSPKAPFWSQNRLRKPLWIASGIGIASGASKSEILLLFTILWNDFGPRFGTPNQAKIDSVFCCVLGHLKKLCSDDSVLHNESKKEPILINFRDLATMRFCCYSLHFRTISHFRNCQISNRIPMPARRHFFFSI